MGSDFTVIQFQRQQFGNQPGSFNDIEPDVPFARHMERQRAPRRTGSPLAGDE